MEIWEESRLDVSPDEEAEEFKNKKCIVYPKEVWNIIIKVLGTYESANAPELAMYNKEVINAVLCVIAYAKDEKEKEKRANNKEIASVEPRNIARKRGWDRLMNMPSSSIRWLIYIYGERWDNLSDEEKIHTIIHELLHIQPQKPDKMRNHDEISDAVKLFEKFKVLREQQETEGEKMVAVAMVKKKKKQEERE